MTSDPDHLRTPANVWPTDAAAPERPTARQTRGRGQQPAREQTWGAPSPLSGREPAPQQWPTSAPAGSIAAGSTARVPLDSRARASGPHDATSSAPGPVMSGIVVWSAIAALALAVLLVSLVLWDRPAGGSGAVGDGATFLVQLLDRGGST